MATLIQIRNAVNARLADWWQKVRARQEAYFAREGRYCQLRPLSSVPDDGAAVTPDLDLGPIDYPAMTGRALSLDTDLPASVEAQIRCDTYEKPAGVHGYTVTVTVSKDGTTYARTAQVEMGVEVTTGAWAAVEV